MNSNQPIQPFIALVTGSRRWDRIVSLNRALNVTHELVYERYDPLVPFHLRHGKAKGADTIAELWAKRKHGVYNDACPADWNGPCLDRCWTNRDGSSHRVTKDDGSIYCPMAGIYRNEAMVDRGAHFGLSFVRNASKGTDDCQKRMIAAGIPVAIIHYRYDLAQIEAEVRKAWTAQFQEATLWDHGQV